LFLVSIDPSLVSAIWKRVKTGFCIQNSAKGQMLQSTSKNFGQNNGCVLKEKSGA
jgi:hypothetical protein